jgi:antitoxin MazE
MYFVPLHGINIALTVEPMKAVIRKMGNSQGVLIPKPILSQLGFEEDVEMEVENDALVIRRPRKKVREGWGAASEAVAQAGDDVLVMGEFAKADDAESTW